MIEPWICANPRDPQNLIVSGSIYRGTAPATTARTTGGVRYTRDGGATWSDGELPGMDDVEKVVINKDVVEGKAKPIYVHGERRIPAAAPAAAAGAKA